MKDNKRNALAELAERLTLISYILRDEGWFAHCANANKAQRIIAELAKIRNHDGSREPMFFDCKNAIRNCREIAEKGE